MGAAEMVVAEEAAGRKAEREAWVAVAVASSAAGVMWVERAERVVVHSPARTRQTRRTLTDTFLRSGRSGPSRLAARISSEKLTLL